MCATRGLFVNVALMSDLYPERDLNPQFLFRKLDFKSSVYTIPPPGCVSPNEISLEWIFLQFFSSKPETVLPAQKSQTYLVGLLRPLSKTHLYKVVVVTTTSFLYAI